MKFLAMFVLLACVVYASSQACPPACADKECCLKPNGANDPGRCSPLLPRNARCRTYNTIQNGGYLYDCPCEEGLNCFRGRCTEPQQPRAPTRSPVVEVEEE